MSDQHTHLLIPKIENGIVFDHIPAGLGPRVLEMIHAYPGTADAVVTLGLNYKSTKLGRKDMIKLGVSELPEPLLEQIALLSPGITIKRVADYKVAGKYGLHPPALLKNLARCRNPNCVSNTERGVPSRFELCDETPRRYRCSYCERVFDLAELPIKSPGQ